MESTIRFTTDSTDYHCKQLNLVTLPKNSISGISTTNNGNTVLSIKDQAIVSLDTDLTDKDFNLSIGYFSVVSELTSSNNSVTIFLQFGYTHNISGFSFSFDPISNPGKKLEIIKTGNTVNVKYDNRIIGSSNEITGPLRYIEVHNNDTSFYPTMEINDVVYTSY